MISLKKILLIWMCIIACDALAQKTRIADSLYRAEQWEQAARAYEKFVEENPKEMPGFYLNRIGQAYYNQKMYDKAITIYKKAVAINGNSTVMYNIACAYSLSGNADSALVWLSRSADAGFTQYEETKKDDDLKSLKDKPAFTEIVAKMKKNKEPCSVQPESHQFDFWIGEWNVFNPQGQQSGTSKIEQILSECVILENWTDYFGNKGKSFNIYNTSTKKWQQTWVDDKGGITEYIDGTYSGDAMRFANSRPQLVNGKEVYRRLTFFKISEKEVRQLGEVTHDLGKTWKPEYDLKYIRTK